MKEKYKPLLYCISLVIYQSILYFIAKLSPFNITLIGSNLDNKIPFIDEFIYFYISWYLMLFVVPYLIYKKDKDIFKKYLITIIACNTFVFFIYFLYPTTINRPNIIVKDITSFITYFIYKIDTPALNCFPSMHCIISFIYMYIVIFENKFSKYRLVIITWSSLIILSTLFVKQHVLLDVLGAFVISLVIYFVVNKKCS